MLYLDVARVSSALLGSFRACTEPEKVLDIGSGFQNGETWAERRRWTCLLHSLGCQLQSQPRAWLTTEKTEAEGGRGSLLAGVGGGRVCMGSDVRFP